MTYRSLLLLSGAILAIGMGSPALAQAAAEGPDGQDAAASQDAAQDITVTGQRQQYLAKVPLREVPQSIQVISGETLKAAGITRLDNALDFASGVSRQNNFGGLFDSFAIRGFSGDENTASNYLVNGFNAARGYGGARDTSNIERVDILKGPNSALFGRGEPGGTINIVTKKPNFVTGGSATLSGGSYNTFRGEGDINLPLSASVAVRVTGAYEQGDSFRDTIETKKYTITPSVLAKLDADTTLTYELEYIRQEVPFDRGIVAVNGKLDTVPRSRFLGEPGDGPIRIRALGHQAQLQHDFSSDWSIVLGVGYRDTSFKGFSSEAELAAGRQKIFTDGQTLSRQRRYRDYSTTDLTIRGELSGKFSTFGLTHNVLIGADWDDFTLDTIQKRFRPAAVASQTTLAAGNAVNIFAPVYGNLPTPGAFIDSTEQQYSYGIYLQDQIDLTDQLKLRLGGRYDSFEQTIDNHLNTTRTGQNKTAFSPQVGLAFLPSRSLTFYASYGKGFRPNTGVTFANQPFTPEQTESYEVGAKLSVLNNRLTGTLALFKTTKTNVLTADPINAGFSLAVGEAESKGVEFEMSGRLPGGIRLQLAYSYIDAEVAKDSLDPNFGFTLHKGDPLINIAKHSGSLLVFKDFDLGGSTLTLAGGVNYVGKRLGETGFRFANGEFFYLPAYTLTRLIASYSPTEHLKFSGEVTNLFDEHYYASSYSRLWITPGTPRQFMVRAAYKF
jgi:iron complex outermembrane receptor protein